MSSNLNDVVEKLSGFTVLEISELTKLLEEKWGVSAAPAVAAAAPAAGGGEAAAEKTEFDVVLDDVGSSKINVIKVVREVTGLGLKEAKELAETAGAKVKEGASKEEAESIKAKLEEAGAKVSVK